MRYSSIYAIAVWLFCASPIATQAQVVINEVTAANYSHTLDNFGEYDDWIELYNTSGTAVDLSGYYLSDRINNNTKYQIPEGCVIEPFGHKLFWCTRMDTDEGGIYHTTFKLTQCKPEPVVFSDPGGNIIDLFEYEFTNQMNHSMGRQPDGGDEWVVYLDPTPGGANTSQPYKPYPKKPVLSHEAGFYQGSLVLTMESDEPNAVIHYTLDSSTPDENAPVYSGAITITETTVVRAVAVSSDPLVPDGFIETNTYFINEEFTVPVVSLVADEMLTLLGGLQIEPVGSFEFFDANGVFRDEGVGEYNKHGNDSWAYPQRGLDWITRDEFGYNDAIHHRIFRGKSRDSFQRLMVKAGANDNYPFENGGHVRDFYVQSLSQMAGLDMDERTGEFCIVYANGQYWGLYDIREKVDDKDFTDYYYGQKREEVDLLKTWGGTWANYGNFDDWIDIRDFILNNDMSDPDNYAHAKSRFNTMSLIDYFVINSYVVAADWLNWNTAWWRGHNPSGGALRWRYIMWDLDAVFGHYTNYTGIPDQSAGADICFPEALGNPGGQGHVPIWNAFLENDEFVADYVNRMSDLANSYFSCEFMQHHLDSLVSFMIPEMPRQIERWGGTYEGWEEALDVIRDFIDVRCTELNENILDCYDDLSGPYDVTVSTEPLNSGHVRVNTMVQQQFPYSGNYFGGVSQNFEAIDRPGYEFSHWTVNGAVVSPGTEAQEIFFELSQNTEIIAHFEASFKYEISLDVLPENSGSLRINGEIIGSFPTTIELAAAVSHELEALAEPGFLFDRWELSMPNTLSSLHEEESELNVLFDGTLTAYFVENNHPVMFDVDPPHMGQIYLDEELIESYPEIRDLPSDFSYHLKATTDVPFYTFDHWEVFHAAPEPDSSSAEVSLVFDQGDVVTARFREIPNYTLTFLTDPPKIGSIRFADEHIEEFPYTVRVQGNQPYSLEGIVPNTYEFKIWDFVMQPTHSGRFYPSLQFIPLRNDTIILRSTERMSAVFIPSAFTPNGDGFNDMIYVQGPEISPDDFEWVIYSRFGDLVFRTNDISQGWNGGVMNSDFFCPVGLYTYHLRYKNAITEMPAVLDGSIMLIR